MTSQLSHSETNNIRTQFEQTRMHCESIRRAPPPLPPLADEMKGRIEHTLLNPATTAAQLVDFCVTARRFDFRGVCCLPRDVAFLKRELSDTAVRIVSVMDFPLGGTPRSWLGALCRYIVDLGADEIDMVINIRNLLDGHLLQVGQHILEVTSHAGDVPVKVILETGYLTDVQIVQGCGVAVACGASFVKTSTGFGPRGASVRDVKIMKAAVGDNVYIKAAGGIRDHVSAKRLLDAGAQVVGTSNGPACLSAH